MARLIDKTQWLRVSRREPCSICAKSDYCTRSADGAVARCMRIESDKPSLKGGWIHKLEPGMVAQVYVKPERPREKVDWTNRAKQFAQDDSAIERLAKTLGVSREALTSLWVGRGYDKAGEFSAWPERESNGTVCGIVRRYWSGEKKAQFGGHQGCYYPTFWADMPGPVYVVEGGSDTAALIDVGVNVIGRPSNTGGRDILTRLLRKTNRLVVVIGENDRKPDRVGTVAQCPLDCQGCSWCWPGKYGARSMMDKIAIQPARLLWIMPPPSAKDVRDFINQQPKKPTPMDFLRTAEGWGR